MEKYNLFIDTATKNFYCSCFSFSSKQPIFCFKLPNNVETCNLVLFSALTKAKVNYEQIKKIYLTVGPGSYTGLRIGAIIARTLANLTKKCAIFSISSLKLQAIKPSVISVISASSQRKNVAVYANTKLVYQAKLDHYADEITLITARYHYPIQIDYENLDLFSAFNSSQKFYESVGDWSQLQLVYELTLSCEPNSLKKNP